MYTGQIKHFFKGGQNGKLTYIKEDGLQCEIPFYRQASGDFMESKRESRGRGWKYGDIVEFEIQMYKDQLEAVFTRFVGNPLVDQLKATLGDRKQITGYFYKHENLSDCTVREKTTGVEFRVKNIKNSNCWNFPENGTEVEATIRKWDTLTCNINEPERNQEFIEIVEKLRTKRVIRATVKELLGNRMQIEIDGVPYPCYVTPDKNETYEIGDPLNVRLVNAEILKFTII